MGQPYRGATNSYQDHTVYRALGRLDPRAAVTREGFPDGLVPASAATWIVAFITLYRGIPFGIPPLLYRFE